MSLADLPPEMVERIASFLDPLALGAMRLTCHDARNKSNDEFRHRVLNQQWLLQEDSLSTLTEIAQDGRFQDKLTSLRLGTHAMYAFDLDQTNRSYDRMPDRSSAWTAFLKYTRQQDNFLQSERPTAMLTAAMIWMPALRNVEIGQWCIGSEEARIGWGGNIIHHATGSGMCGMWHSKPPRHGALSGDALKRYCPNFTDTVAIVFTNFLSALSVTHHPIERLSVVFYHGHLWPMDVTFMQTLTPGTDYHRGVTSALTRLKTLRLALEYRWMGRSHVDNPDPNGWLTNFVGLAPCLESLSLFFSGFDSWSDCLNDQIPFGHFAVGTHLAHLRNLELGNVVLEPQHLALLISKHRATLAQVSLLRVSLRGSASHDLQWPELLLPLCKDGGAELTLIKLSCLYESDGAVLVFATEGVEQCQECGPPSRHTHAYWGLGLKCHHVTFISDNGRIPSMICRRDIARGDI